VPQSYGTGRIEAQAQSARLSANLGLIGKKLLNDAKSGQPRWQWCRSGNDRCQNGHNHWLPDGFSRL
jgi:hypothetical protein